MSIINLRGKCRHLGPKCSGHIGCWLKKGHRGPHSSWIYKWKRRPHDAEDTRKRLKQERQDAHNTARRHKRSEEKWKAYNAQFTGYVPNYQ